MTNDSYILDIVEHCHIEFSEGEYTVRSYCNVAAIFLKRNRS